MSTIYYYAVASLPSLRWGQAPPFGVAEFAGLLRGNLGPGEQALVEGADLWRESEQPTGLADVDRWYARERSLRNTLARLRGQFLGVEGGRHAREPRWDQDPEAAAMAARLFGMESPLAAEEALDAWRWQGIEELGWGHAFDLERIVFYGLQLRLLQRQASFRAAAGRQRLRAWRDRAQALSQAAWVGGG